MTAAAALPARELLCQLFYYEPLAGILLWAVRPHARSKRRAGDIAGTVNEAGYLQVGIGRKVYLVHRIIWKMVHETEPPEIDHRNGVHCENRLSNLRAATRSSNSRNRRVLKNNKLGLKGVIFVARINRYLAQIDYEGKRRKLGHFKTPNEAHAAYVAAARELYGEFANDGMVSEDARKAVLLPTGRKA